jgi:ABC-type nitrate/sulfonate/bicarbonate transport system substrate-binding protein
LARPPARSLRPFYFQQAGDAIIAVADYLNLVPPGFIAGDRLISEHPEIVQKFVNASLRGYRDALADPNAAFEATLKRMPELSTDKQPLQRDTLTATLDYYKAPQGRAPGSTDPDGWAKTQTFLQSIGVIDRSIDPAQYYTNTFTERATP